MGIYGSVTRTSTTKTGYTIPRNIMANSDITRIIHSDEIQSVLNAPKQNVRLHSRQEKNPLKNWGVKVRLNPYAVVQRRARILASKSKNAVSDKKRAANAEHAATKAENWARLSA